MYSTMNSFLTFLGLLVGLLYIGSAIYFKAFTHGRHEWRHIIVLVFVGGLALLFVHSSQSVFTQDHLKRAQILAFTGAIVMWVEYIAVLSDTRTPISISGYIDTVLDTDIDSDSDSPDDHP